MKREMLVRPGVKEIKVWLWDYNFTNCIILNKLPNPLKSFFFGKVNLKHLHYRLIRRLIGDVQHSPRQLVNAYKTE